MEASRLLTPVLSDHVPRDRAARLPWRLSSQVYVALLGGPIAITVIAALNVTRLRTTPRSMLPTIVAIGLAGTLAAVLAAALLPIDGPARIVIQLSGALAYGPMYLLQRPHDRVHAMFSPNDDDDLDYESLWGPGIAAVVGGLIVAGILVAGAMGA